MCGPSSRPTRPTSDFHWNGQFVGLPVDRLSRIPEYLAAFRPLREAVLDWAARFHLCLNHPKTGKLVPAAWVYDVLAVMTIWYSLQVVRGGRDLRFPFVHGSFPYGEWVEQVIGRHYVLDLPIRGPNPLRYLRRIREPGLEIH